jgi:hypothetical protein
LDERSISPFATASAINAIYKPYVFDESRTELVRGAAVSASNWLAGSANRNKVVHTRKFPTLSAVGTEFAFSHAPESAGQSADAMSDDAPGT